MSIFNFYDGTVMPLY